MSSDEPVTIVDREVLKVLSTDTRMDILKMLSKGDRTPSFIGKKLGKTSSTIVEHLDVLVRVGLVKKLESPGKKWVFYSLTERGEGIVKTRTRRLIIILATSLFALLGSIGSFGWHFYTQSAVYVPRAMEGIEEIAKGPPFLNVTTTTVREFVTTLTTQPVYLYLAVILFIISGVGFVVYFYKKSKFKEVKI